MAIFERKKNDIESAEDFLKRAAAGLSPEDKIPLTKITDEVGIPPESMVNLLTGLEADAALRREDDNWILTEKGWAQGRQLLRAHRIYESYLAEQTGIAPAQWHSHADRLEHELQAHEVERMAAELNQPRFDPHGDAIPTQSLEIQETEGQLLSQIQQDGEFRIVHIEDEPKDTFEQSIRAGLAPELFVAVEVMNAGRYRLSWAGRDTLLNSAQAAGLKVCKCQHRNTADLPQGNLLQLTSGHHARVHSISPAIRGLQRRRLLDLGFVPGSLVSKEGHAAFGGPMAFRIRGTLQALRPELASNIFTQE